MQAGGELSIKRSKVKERKAASGRRVNAGTGLFYLEGGKGISNRSIKGLFFRREEGLALQKGKSLKRKGGKGP